MWGLVKNEFPKASLSLSLSHPQLALVHNFRQIHTNLRSWFTQPWSTFNSIKNHWRNHQTRKVSNNLSIANRQPPRSRQPINNNQQPPSQKAKIWGSQTCMCVCVWERERERDALGFKQIEIIMVNSGKA